MRAWVAGATGYTGRSVVHELVAHGVDVTAHARPDSPGLERFRAEAAALGVRVEVTPWEDAALVDALRRERPDLVFALLGTTAAKARQAAHEGRARADYEAVDYGLTMRLARAVRAAVPTARFIHLSSVGASEHARGAYLRVRGRAERDARALGLRMVIVRPSFLSGPDRAESRPAERIGAVLTDLVTGFAGRLGMRSFAQRYRSLDARTFARGLVALALDPASEGRVLESGDLRRAAGDGAPDPDRASSSGPGDVTGPAP